MQSDSTNISTYAEKQSWILNGYAAVIAKNITDNKLYDSQAVVRLLFFMVIN